MNRKSFRAYSPVTIRKSRSVTTLEEEESHATMGPSASCPGGRRLTNYTSETLDHNGGVDPTMRCTGGRMNRGCSKDRPTRAPSFDGRRGPQEHKEQADDPERTPSTVSLISSDKPLTSPSFFDEADHMTPEEVSEWLASSLGKCIAAPTIQEMQRTVLKQRIDSAAFAALVSFCTLSKLGVDLSCKDTACVQQAWRSTLAFRRRSRSKTTSVDGAPTPKSMRKALHRKLLAKVGTVRCGDIRLSSLLHWKVLH